MCARHLSACAVNSTQISCRKCWIEDAMFLFRVFFSDFAWHEVSNVTAAGPANKQLWLLLFSTSADDAVCPVLSRAANLNAGARIWISFNFHCFLNLKENCWINFHFLSKRRETTAKQVNQLRISIKTHHFFNVFHSILFVFFFLFHFNCFFLFSFAPFFVCKLFMFTF